jgi:hypothetical protein
MNHSNNNQGGFRGLIEEDELLFKQRGLQIKHNINNKVTNIRTSTSIFDLFSSRLVASFTMLLGTKEEQGFDLRNPPN